MKIKKLLSILLVSTVALGLVSCGSDSSKATDASSNTDKAEKGGKITVWAWDESFNIKAVNDAKAMYQKNNPDVEIDVVTMAQNDIVTKLNTSLASGSYEGLPNVVLVEDYRIQGYLQSYPKEFADLSSVAKIGDFAPYKTGVTAVDGKLYGIPFDSGVAATFYRKDMIEQAGYTDADMQNLTWDKYIEIAKAVKEKTGKDMCTLDPSDLGQIRMMLQSAGSWYTDASGKVTIADNNALKEAITTYKNLATSGAVKQISGWDQFVGAFNNGEVASVITGCWIVPSIKKAEDQSGKWGVAAFPKLANDSKGVNASSLGGSSWYVLNNVKGSDIAVDFLGKTFASDTTLINQLASDIGLVSTVNASESCENYATGVEFFGGQKIFQDFLKWNKDVPSVNYGMNTYAIESIMTEAVQAIVGGSDIDSTLQKFQTQVESAVAK